MDAIIGQKTRTVKKLRVGFVIGAYPKPDFVQKSARAAWGKFLEDMGKQGWHYTDSPITWQGPQPHIPLKTLPKVAEQMKRNPFEFVQEVPTLETAENWIYFLEAEFWRDLPKAEFLVTSPGEMPVDYPEEIKRRINASADA